MDKIYCIIPVFNEEANIPRLMEGLKDITVRLGEYACTVIIVDDGSTDNTVMALKEHGDDLDLVILSHEITQGPGYAFGTGFQHLAERLDDKDIVVTMEGDNTSRFETLSIMIERQKREGHDVVLASPYAYGGGIVNTNWHRTFISHIANLFIKEFLGIRGIHTMSSFFRVYRASIIKKLQARYGPRILERRGFESMLELLKKMIIQKATISEVEMKLDTSLRSGKSKMKVLKTVCGYINLFFIMRRWY